MSNKDIENVYGTVKVEEHLIMFTKILATHAMYKTNKKNVFRSHYYNKFFFMS